MRNLKDMEGKRLVTDQEKVKGLFGNLFGWGKDREEGRNGRREEEREGYGEEEVKVMAERVERALMGMKNS